MMMFESTNQSCKPATFYEAMRNGLAPDGGLYMPVKIPALANAESEAMPGLSFRELSFIMARPFLHEELNDEQLHGVIDDAFNFPVVMKKLEKNIYVLELFHGPTLAFKDFGARFMARLFSERAKRGGEKITILVATSGDTGSAVANGFHNVDGVDVCVLYPKGKVSPLQEMQMATLGGNIRAIEVNGVFDDCQRLVKQAMLDRELTSEMQVSSANSINIARLLPQSFYYGYASAGMSRKQSQPPVFSVPSGNFGNLTGGLIAARMGVSAAGFIAATNLNNAVPEFLSGKPYKPRKSVQTISNAMDVGDPSNFARIRHLYGNSDHKIRDSINGYSFTDGETKQTFSNVFKTMDYLMCPHTAIGYRAAEKYIEKYGSNNPLVVLATAHPVKFRDVIEPAIGEKIDVPARLKEAIHGSKKTVEMEPDYQEFKSLLMENE